jgi:hypothetical protein
MGAGTFSYHHGHLGVHRAHRGPTRNCLQRKRRPSQRRDANRSAASRASELGADGSSRSGQGHGFGEYRADVNCTEINPDALARKPAV